MKAKLDYLFLGILALLILNTVIQSIRFNYLLSLNNYLGFVAWGIALGLRVGNTKYKRLGLDFILLLGALNILNFTIGTMTISVGNISDTYAEPVGLNPVLLLILIVYYLTNRKAINKIFFVTFQGIKEEQELERQKLVNFYTEKFGKCSSNELEELFKDLENYSLEEQIALERIKSQMETRFNKA